MARRGRPSLLKSDLVPVPIGMNTADPASALGPLDSVYQINLIANDRGLKPRPGFSEWATNIGAVQPAEVRSVLSYGGSTGSQDRLWAVATDGVYDCTAGGAAPSRVLAFGTVDANSGYCNGTSYTNAGARFFAMCDESNGYQLYTEATGLWTAGSVTGVSPAALDYVLQWKNRLWFIEGGSSRAWYLATGAISGAATSFDFGPFFQYGGYLLGIYRWTIDAGQGADDYFVAISSAGDAVVFQGTDPASNFLLRGIWYLGGVPTGRRVGVSHGGDLLILTNLGIINLSALVTGQLVTPDTYETRKVRPFVMETLAATSNLRGWQMMWHPEDNFLVVNTPLQPGVAQEQLAMSGARKGWARLRGLDILSMEVFQRQLYFGTRDGRLCKMTGTVDNVKLGGVTTNATAVECSVLAAFNTLNDAHNKQVRLVQPFFITHGLNPTVELLIRYNYDTSEPSGTLNASPPGAGTWDAAIWDTAVWGGGPAQYAPVLGANGFGRTVAVGVHFFSSDYTVLTGFALHWETGGIL